MEIDLSAFLDEFRAEAADHLRTMDAQLLQLERDPAAPEPIRQMFLSAHTIKGGAAMMGLEEVRELAHALEDVLGCLRDRGQPLDPRTADLLFRALDALREMVDSPGSGAAPAATSELVVALRRRATVAAEAEPSPVSAEPSPPPAPGVLVEDSTALRFPAEPLLPPAPRVLLVEDSPTVRLLEQMLLSDAGFEVDVVEDGQEALARARARSYRLVVAGIELRGLRGLELAAALRGSPSCRPWPIILTSSHDDAEQRRQAEEIGVQALIQKGSPSRHRLVEAAREALSATS